MSQTTFTGNLRSHASGAFMYMKIAAAHELLNLIGAPTDKAGHYPVVGGNLSWSLANNGGNGLANFLLPTGQKFVLGPTTYKIGSTHDGKPAVFFDWKDQDLDDMIAEAENAEIAAAATPGFNENPTLVQFFQKQVTEVKRRAGQERWKRELRREDGACVVSGAKEANEASHLNYPGKPLSLRGVLLRMDLAHLFDYKGAKLTSREDGTLFWDYPGHEFHGKTLNLSPEKAKAIILELTQHRPQETA